MIVDRGTSKTTIIILVAIIIVLVGILVVSIFQKDKRTETKNTSNPELNIGEKLEDKVEKDISVVPTMQDKISENSTWCGTFQLVWNDMQNNLIDGDVEFSESNEMVTNLNKQKFTENSISQDYYYKKWGKMTLDLKKEIEDGIKKKFNEKSDILDLFNWPKENEKPEDEYLFYSMLRRNFEFENEFSKLGENKFGNSENVEYFGINNETDEVVRNQVEVLYYNDENDFAVVLYTKQGDNVMLVRNPKGTNFDEIYENSNKKADKYKGNRNFGEEDTLSVPNLNLDILKEYSELENIPFKTKDGNEVVISQAFQTIKMTLDNKGGSIKSEAGMAIKETAFIDKEEPRDFNFNDEFAIFLLTDTNEPYFAANIKNMEFFK